MKHDYRQIHDAIAALASSKQQEARSWQALVEAVADLVADHPETAVMQHLAPQAPVSPSAKAYLTTKEAAEYLGISHQTLNIWRVRGGGPPFSKIGRLVRYSMDDLTTYATRSRYPHTSAYTARK